TPSTATTPSTRFAIRTAKGETMNTNAQPSNDRDQRPRAEWETVKVFADDETGYRVTVDKLPLFNPVFSIRVTGTGKDGQETRSIRPKFDADGSTVKSGMTLARLIDEANLLIDD